MGIICGSGIICGPIWGSFAVGDHLRSRDHLRRCTGIPGGVLPSNRLMGMCRWMGSHSHDLIDYDGVAFSLGANRATRMGSHICGISGVSKFRQVGIWGIFAQK